MAKKKLITEQYAEHRAKINSNSFATLNEDTKNTLIWLTNKKAREDEAKIRSAELINFYQHNIEDLALRLAEAEMWIEIQTISSSMLTKVYEISAKENDRLVQQRIMAGKKRNAPKRNEMDKHLDTLREEANIFFKKNKTEINRSQFFKIAENKIPRSLEAIEKYWLIIKGERNIPT